MVSLGCIVWACSRKKELRPIAFGVVWFILGMFSFGDSGNPEKWMALPQVLFPFMGLMLALMAWIAHSLRHWRRCSPHRFSLMIPVVLLSVALVLGVHAIATYKHHERGFSNGLNPEMGGVEIYGLSSPGVENG